jgi:quinol monooxygenase YgiN
VIIVAGSVRVDPEARDAYLDGCREVVAGAREAPGCLDFALSPDLLEPGRINVFERWESASALEAFRGSGPPDDQLAQLREINVSEYEVRKADQ